MGLKLRYVNPVLDSSGYAACGRSYIRALIEAGNDVSINQVSFEEARPELGSYADYILPNIDKNNNYDVNIVHLTPEQYPIHLQYGKVNIGFTVWETTKIPDLWVECCNSMDAIIVPCEWNVKVFRNSGVTVPIFCVPHVVDLGDIDTVPEFSVDGVSNTSFKFYSICQFTERKDIISLLKAYWYAFDSNDDVVLILKTYRSNYSDSETKVVIETIKRIKAIMPMPDGRGYPRVNVITDMLSVDEITGLHKYGDCFVSLNRAEGFGLPEAEAATVGNPNIVTGFGGVLEFLNNTNSLLVNYTLTPVSGMPHIPWYKGDQLWAQADVEHAALCMRKIFDDKELYNNLSKNSIEQVSNKLSSKNIGELYTKTIMDIVSMVGRG